MSKNRSRSARVSAKAARSSGEQSPSHWAANSTLWRPLSRAKRVRPSGWGINGAASFFVSAGEAPSAESDIHSIPLLILSKSQGLQLRLQVGHQFVVFHVSTRSIAHVLHLPDAFLQFVRAANQGDGKALAVGVSELPAMPLASGYSSVRRPACRRRRARLCRFLSIRRKTGR